MHRGTLGERESAAGQRAESGSNDEQNVEICGAGNCRRNTVFADGDAERVYPGKAHGDCGPGCEWTGRL